MKGNSTEEIKAALEQNTADGFQPTLEIWKAPMAGFYTMGSLAVP